MRSDASWPMAAQIGVLGSVHMLSCAAVYTAVAIGSRRVLRTKPVAARAVSRLSGLAMVLIGVGLLVEQVLART